MKNEGSSHAVKRNEIENLAFGAEERARELRQENALCEIRGDGGCSRESIPAAEALEKIAATLRGAARGGPVAGPERNALAGVDEPEQLAGVTRIETTTIRTTEDRPPKARPLAKKKGSKAADAD